MLERILPPEDFALCGRAPADPIYNPVDEDLVPHYRCIVPGRYWAYVCPCCKYVFLPGLAGMPDSFRTHIRDFVYGNGGCFFRPKPIGCVKPRSKHAERAASF